MMPDAIRSFEWLLQIATSLVFLVPGYLVISFLQTTRETKLADNFELTIKSLIYSLVVAGIWFYLTPPGDALRQLLGTPNVILLKLLQPKPIFSSILWLAGITAGVALISGYILHWQLYWKVLRFLRFGRLNSYITTWEELSDLASSSWVSVETKNGQTYTGVISSVTHHPYERALILSRSKNTPMSLMTNSHKQEDCEVECVWLSGDSIASIGVFKKNNK